MIIRLAAMNTPIQLHRRDLLGGFIREYEAV
jgi:hypothetical protein